MKRTSIIVSGLMGLALGIIGSVMYLSQPRLVQAASNDRYGDFILATGSVSVRAGVQTDGVWLLDYRTGKLLGTVIDRTQGRIMGWAEVDLTRQFDVKPLQDVHFMMATGYITQGQSALYVAETNTGKFGVFTMGPGPNGGGVVIRQHDMTTFRQVQEEAPVLPNQPAAPAIPGVGAPPAPPEVPVVGAPGVGAPGLPIPAPVPSGNPGN